MTRSPEIYTPGYSEPTLRLMLKRTAAKNAAFFIPFLRRGMRVLDCGCGPATITLDLANLVSPGQVVGIDLEATQLRSAQTASRKQRINACFAVASVYDLPFADGLFDAVFAHALFEHLREPARALSEIRRVLRSSGIVGLRSPDWAGWFVQPPCSLIEEAFRLFKEIQISNGGNPHVGRALRSLLRKSGFSNVSLAASYELVYDPAFFIEWLACCLEHKGHTELRQNAKEVREWSEHPDAFVAVSWFEGLGIA